MNKDVIIKVLEDCKHELQSMTQEEFDQRKIDLGLNDKVYMTDSYKTNLLNIILMGKI